MPWPHITAAYLAVLALLYCALAVHVVVLRVRHRAAFGDGDCPALRSAIRAHAHFAEYVPITALMIAMLEMSGAPASRVQLLLIGLLLSRLMHPIGMRAAPATLQFRIFRTGGMWLTQIVLVSAAVTLLLRALRAA
jgi:uncharacterized membrane protein YecN with MAPEG domain